MVSAGMISNDNPHLMASHQQYCFKYPYIIELFVLEGLSNGRVILYNAKLTKAMTSSGYARVLIRPCPISLSEKKPFLSPSMVNRAAQCLHHISRTLIIAGTITVMRCCDKDEKERECQGRG